MDDSISCKSSLVVKKEKERKKKKSWSKAVWKKKSIGRVEKRRLSKWQVLQGNRVPEGHCWQGRQILSWQGRHTYFVCKRSIGYDTKLMINNGVMWLVNFWFVLSCILRPPISRCRYRSCLVPPLSQYDPGCTVPGSFSETLFNSFSNKALTNNR